VLRIRPIATAVAVAVAALASLPSAATGRHTAKPRVLHLTFRQVASSGSVFAGDRYALVGDELVDHDAGAITTVSPPCSPPSYATFGGPWLMVQCDASTKGADLYNIAGATWSHLALQPALQAGCDEMAMGNCSLAAIGTHWLKVQIACYHCTTSYTLQNLKTGATEPDPGAPGGTVLDDLDSATGSARLCRPLRYPASYELAGLVGGPGLGPAGIGTLRFLGPFALAMGQSYGSRQGQYEYTHLERCGSKLQIDLPRDATVAASRSAVVWQTQPSGAIHGLFLPSLRRFTIDDAPAALAGLSEHTLYLQAPFHGAVWTARLPAR
jgi:hypothetical protein